MDLIREIRIKLHGFGLPSLDNTIVLIKMLPVSTKVSTLKQSLEKLLTNQFYLSKSSSTILPPSEIETIAPVDRQTLQFKQEILWDDFGLDHYKFRNRLGQNYAELNLFLNEHLAQEETINVSVKARSAWLRAGEQVRKKVHQAFIPDPNLATKWIPKAGYPYESQSTRHARTRGGTNGIIELLKEYPKHSTSAEECCWTLLQMASKSDDANDFRERLIEKEFITPIIVKSFQRALKKLHWGAMKQSLGLLWYLAKDQSSIYIKQLCTFKLIEFSTEAIKFVTRALKKLKLAEKTSALASCFCDIAELASNLICCIVTEKDGRGVFKGIRVKDVFENMKNELEGVPSPEYILDAFERCVNVAARKKPVKKKKSFKKEVKIIK